jgi:hypothetical protein
MTKHNCFHDLQHYFKEKVQEFHQHYLQVHSPYIDLKIKIMSIYFFFGNHMIVLKTFFQLHYHNLHYLY